MLDTELLWKSGNYLHLVLFFLSNMEYFVWFCFQGAGLRDLSLLATASSTAEEILLPAICAGQVPPFFHIPEKTFVLLPLLTASPELVQPVVLQPPQLVTTSPAVWWRWACCRLTLTQAALNYLLPFFFLLVLFVFLLTHSEDKNVAYFFKQNGSWCCAGWDRKRGLWRDLSSHIQCRQVNTSPSATLAL